MISDPSQTPTDKLGDAIRAYRLRHRLGQKQVAAFIGIHTNHYQQIEYGTVKPSGAVRATIMRILIAEYRQTAAVSRA